MRVFTFSPIVSPKCESSWERGLFSVQGPSCLSCLPLTPPAARPPPSCQTSALGLTAPLPGVLSVRCRASSPTTCFALLTPSCLSLFCCHLFVLREVRCRGGLGCVPFHSASELGAGPGFTGPRGRTSSRPRTVPAQAQSFSLGCSECPVSAVCKAIPSCLAPSF